MKIKGISYLAVKTGGYGGMRDFFKKVLGMDTRHESLELAVFEPVGDNIEIFGQEGRDLAHQFDAGNLICGFLAEDLLEGVK